MKRNINLPDLTLYRKRDAKEIFKSRWDNEPKGKNRGFNEKYEKTFTPMPF